MLQYMFTENMTAATIRQRESLCEIPIHIDRRRVASDVDIYPIGDLDAAAPKIETEGRGKLSQTAMRIRTQADQSYASTHPLRGIVKLSQHASNHCGLLINYRLA